MGSSGVIQSCVKYPKTFARCRGHMIFNFLIPTSCSRPLGPVSRSRVRTFTLSGLVEAAGVAPSGRGPSSHPLRHAFVGASVLTRTAVCNGGLTDVVLSLKLSVRVHARFSTSCGPPPPLKAVDTSETVTSRFLFHRFSSAHPLHPLLGSFYPPSPFASFFLFHSCLFKSDKSIHLFFSYWSSDPMSDIVPDAHVR